MAEQTVNNEVATQQSNGAFTPVPGYPADPSPSLSTMWFGIDMETVYLELEPGLDPATKTAWQAAISSTADYVISKSGAGALMWYTNGNVNLGDAEYLYLAWRITGNAAFGAAYQQAWSFLISPPQSRWPGYGLQLTTTPTAPDGSNGAGYLAESGIAGVGFDPEYTTLQLDEACGLYLFSRDPNALSLCNEELNQLQPLVNPTTDDINTTGGTRHPVVDDSIPFVTDADAVLGLVGGRSSLDSEIIPELDSTEQAMEEPWSAYSDVYRRGLGNEIDIIAIAASEAGAPPVLTFAPLPTTTAASTTTAAKTPVVSAASKPATASATAVAIEAAKVRASTKKTKAAARANHAHLSHHDARRRTSVRHTRRRPVARLARRRAGTRRAHH